MAGVMVVLLANQVLLIPEVEAEGLTNLLPLVATAVPASCVSVKRRSCLS